MTDVVPEMLSDIDSLFKAHTMADRKLATVSKRIRDGTATQIDGHLYAERLGHNASRALQEVLTPDRLPDGKLYYNIATRTVVPTLENNQRLVNEAATSIQSTIDAKSGIRMGSIEPEFPKSRVNGLIDKMCAEGIEIEDALKWLGEPIVNNSEAFYDDFQRDNAEFRYKSGLKTTITRIAEPKCCEWCAGLEGTYDYAYAGDLPEDIYRRHEFCRCSVTVTYKRTTENVWTKRSWASTPEEIARREETKPEGMTAKERQEVLRRLEQDSLVKRIMDATGYDRETASYIARQSPEKIDKALATHRNAMKYERRNT